MTTNMRIVAGIISALCFIVGFTAVLDLSFPLAVQNEHVGDAMCSALLTLSLAAFVGTTVYRNLK